MNDVVKTILLKTGPVGALLIWQLYQNQIFMERLFKSLEADTAAKMEMANEFAKLRNEVYSRGQHE